MHFFNRSRIFPERELPEVEDLVAEGHALSQEVVVGTCPFLDHNSVKSEMEYKQKEMRKGRIMLHAQIGYRSLKKTIHGFTKIYERITNAGYTIDRYGICLDWSMGYPSKIRTSMPQGTGLILNKPEDFISLTSAAPVAPHFGDFVIGTPASVENAVAAIQAGATTIGNIGQYFTFRMPRWQDDISTTAETVKALALCNAQPVDVMIHSNLDDGFAALFRDMACSIGAILIEKYIIEDLMGGYISHCYGHTFSEPLTRFAFLQALSEVTETPGSMIYGNTTIYSSREIENYANLASYLLIDILGQRIHPTGHGINPVPVTEALHIPEIEDIINAHLVANRLIHRSEGYSSLLNCDIVNEKASILIKGGILFKERVLTGLKEAGIDIANPFEALLAIRRIGAKSLELAFGPGKIKDGQRAPVIKATTLNVLEKQSQELIGSLRKDLIQTIRNARFSVCLACTDVHEYGKILVEETLKQLRVKIIDAGVSTDTNLLAEIAKKSNADFIAISTYSGVALNYLKSLRQDMSQIGLDIPIFIGGKLTQILDDSSLSRPAEVNEELQSLGAIVCLKVEDMLIYLEKTARGMFND
ncbi:MAG: cobalamin-dependent protein [Candidatus Hodarchaeota archaeon]